MYIEVRMVYTLANDKGASTKQQCNIIYEVGSYVEAESMAEKNPNEIVLTYRIVSMHERKYAEYIHSDITNADSLYWWRVTVETYGTDENTGERKRIAKFPILVQARNLPEALQTVNDKYIKRNDTNIDIELVNISRTDVTYVIEQVKTNKPAGYNDGDE